MAFETFSKTEHLLNFEILREYYIYFLGKVDNIPRGVNRDWN